MTLSTAIDPGYRALGERPCEVDRPPCTDPGVRYVTFPRPNGAPESRWVCPAHARVIEAAVAAEEKKMAQHPPLVINPNPLSGHCRIVGCVRVAKARGLCGPIYDACREDGTLETWATPAKTGPAKAVGSQGAVKRPVPSPPPTEGATPTVAHFRALTAELEETQRALGVRTQERESALALSRRLKEDRDALIEERIALQGEVERLRAALSASTRPALSLTEADLLRRLALLQASAEDHAEADRIRARAEKLRAEALGGLPTDG